MSEWRESKIDALCEAIIDCVNKTAPIAKEVTPYRMIRTSNVKNGIIDLTDTKYVDHEVFVKWTRRSTLEKGDIVLTREAPLGEVGRILNGENLFLGQRLMMYRSNREVVDPDFLFYSFFSREVQHQIKSFGMGSTVEHMRVGDCSEIVIKHPELEEQKAIAAVLSCLDAKIENLRRQNETLEAIAQTLFKHWFIDFEFPNPDGKPYKSSGGAMEPSELGEIPEGWRVGTLGDVATNHSKTHKFKEKAEVIFVNTGDVLEGNFLHQNYSPIEILPGQAKKQISKNDILYSEIRPINKRFAYVNFDKNIDDYVVSTKFMVVRANSEILSRLLYLILKRKETVEAFQQIAESRSGLSRISR